MIQHIIIFEDIIMFDYLSFLHYYISDTTFENAILM